MKLKIAILAPIAWRTPPKKYGPWELVASNLTEGLVKRGFDVTLFATANSITKAKLHAICPMGYEENKNIDPEVWKFLHISEVFERAEDFDIIHNHFDYPPLAFSKLIKTPVLTTIHGFSSPKIIPIYKKYTDNVYYVSISNSDRHPDLKYIDTVYNGINLKDFTFIPEKGNYLVFLGRICHEKGVYQAIQIAKKSNKKLKIAGIIQEPEYYKKFVKPFIDNKKIYFLGLITNNERNELLGNAIALLHPVQNPERFGLVMAEAMACGTPVIGFDLGSVSEIVEHNKTGFVVDNINEAVEYIEKIDLIDRSDCRKRVENHFSIDNMVTNYIRIYEKILSIENAK
ncbi:MAG: glycosyltransferase family 4 protein [Promethearchaeota archaeon]